jgi:hypothetical protein
MRARRCSARRSRDLFALVAERFGIVHYLANVAGQTLDRPIAEMGVDDFRAVVDSHLLGTFLCSAATDLTGRANGANYCAAKPGVMSLTKCFAIEYAPNIAVNCLVPGWTETEDIVRRFGIDAPDRRRQLESGILLGRLAQPWKRRTGCGPSARIWATRGCERRVEGAPENPMGFGLVSLFGSAPSCGSPIWARFRPEARISECKRSSCPACARKSLLQGGSSRGWPSRARPAQGLYLRVRRAPWGKDSALPVPQRARALARARPSVDETSVVFEATGCAFALYDTLLPLAREVVVANPLGAQAVAAGTPTRWMRSGSPR